MAEKFGLNGRKIEKEIWAVFKKIYARPKLAVKVSETKYKLRQKHAQETEAKLDSHHVIVM